MSTNSTYQLFEAWSRLIVPCVPQTHLQSHDTLDAGIKVLTYILNTWRFKNIDDDFSFDIIPIADDTTKAVEDLEDQLKVLHEDDADVECWLPSKELRPASEDTFASKYAAVVRRGFRQLFGVQNVSVRSQKSGAIRVHLTGLKRQVLLACVRRIVLECDAVIGFGKDKFSILSQYHNCHFLKDLILSNEEIALACSIDL